MWVHRRVLWNISLSLTLNLVQRMAGTLAFIAIGRLRTTNDAGVFSLALGYLAILTTLFTSLDDILVRECARTSRHTSPIIITYGVIRAGLGAGGWVLLGGVLAGLSLYSMGDWAVVAIITSSLLLDTFGGVAQAVFNTHGRFGWPLVATTFGTLVKLCGAIWALVNHYSLLFLAVAWPIGSAFTTFILVYALRSHLIRREGKLEIQFDHKWAKQLVRAIPAFMTTSLLSGLEYQLDIILLSVLLSKHEVALYTAAVTIMMVVTTASQAYRTVLYPVMVRSLANKPQAIYSLVKRSLWTMGGMALLIAVAITILAPAIVSLLYGNHFVKSMPILQVLIWNVVLFFLNVPLVRFMLANDGQSIVWRTVLVSLTVNVTVNLLMIPQMGVLAPAYARLASSSVFCGLTAWQVFHRLSRISHM